MKKFVVLNQKTCFYLAPNGKNGDLNEARLFNNRSAARQAANRWTAEADVVEVDVTLCNKKSPTKPTPTPDFSNVGVLKFKDVVQFYRTFYSVDLTGSQSPAYILSLPLISFLENNNVFLRTMTNGGRLVIMEKDFEKSIPIMRLLAKHIIDELGVDSPTGRFCLFEIDWKDENGKIRADY